MLHLPVIKMGVSMKVLLSVLLFVFSVGAIELGSFIPLHFSCVDPSVHTDLGVVNARLDVFKKGTTFTAQLILSKDNAFVTGYKQSSTASTVNGRVSFVPQGHAYQLDNEGAVIPLQDAAIVITQSSSKGIQIRFNSQTGPYITYARAHCR